MTKTTLCIVSILKLQDFSSHTRMGFVVAVLLLVASNICCADHTIAEINEDFQIPDGVTLDNPVITEPTTPTSLSESPQADKLFSFADVVGSGLEAARGVAQLVSATFGHQAQTEEPPETVSAPPLQFPSSHELLSGFFRLAGFSQSNLGAMAVNAVIFLAQMIGNTIKGKLGGAGGIGEEDEVKAPQGTLWSWLFSDAPATVSRLMREAQDRSLPEKVIEILREKSPMETDCVQLLVCKLSPVVWAMQRSIGQSPAEANIPWKSLSPVQRMFAYFPTIQQIADHGASCEMRFPKCRIRYQSDFK